MTHRTSCLRSLGLITLLAAAWAGAAAGCGNAAPAGTGATAGTGAAAGTGAGTATSASAGTAAGGSTTAMCALGGASCTALPCCSGLCTGGMCICTAAAGNCQSGSQCCSGVCAGGVCAPCNQGASLCTESANCCSGICSAGVCGGSTFSCEVMVTSGTTTVHQCSEYVNLPAADLASAQQACAAEMGTPGTACSTTDALGTCTVTSGALEEKQVYYADGTITAATAQQACSSANGTWTPG